MGVFQVDSANLHHDTIDGEAIIINANTGNYFSLDSVGTYVWELLKYGSSVEGLIESVSAHYEGDKREIESGIRSFLDDLISNGLVIEVAGVDSGVPHENGVARGATSVRHFKVPVLSTFTDMQDLLLLDPIHDVDERGWPHKDADA